MSYTYKCIQDIVMKPQINSSVDEPDIFIEQKERMLNNWNKVRFLKVRNDFNGRAHLHHVLVSDIDADSLILPWDCGDLYHYDYSELKNAEAKLADLSAWLFSVIQHSNTEILYSINGFYSAPSSVSLSVHSTENFSVSRFFSDNHYSLSFSSDGYFGEKHYKSLNLVKNQIQKILKL